MNTLEMKLLLCIWFLSTFQSMAWRTCFDISSLPYIEANLKVLSFPFLITRTPGPMKCAVECARFKACLSFNYQTDENLCHLFDISTLYPSFRAKGCYNYLFANIVRWPKDLLGECSCNKCETGEFCTPGHRTHTCTALGKPRTCKDLQQCHPGAPDGDYWLYPANSRGRRVRVFCHGLGTTDPREYVSLVEPNRGYFPDVENPTCSGEIPADPSHLKYAGTRTFYKIRIDLQNLQIDVNDTTFASGVDVIYPYATAVDCYSAHTGATPSSCGTKGNFTIDLRGTGFEISPVVVWNAFGSQPHMIATEISPTVVHLKCGGYCGGCQPVPFILDLLEEDLPLKDARQLYCPP